MKSGKGKLSSVIVCIAMFFLFFQMAPQENASAVLIEEWASFYDGPAHSRDWGQVVLADDSGNAYVTGLSWGGGGCVGGQCAGPMYDFVTIKYDDSGVEQWVKIWNGAGDAYDLPWDMARDPNNGNLYVVGESTSEYGYFYDELDYAIVAYSTAGVELWNRTFEGTAEENDSAYAVAVDPASGNVYVTGKSRSFNDGFEFVTLAYSSTGTLLWDSRIHSPDGFSYFGRWCDVAVGPSGTVYFTGDYDGNYIHTVAYNPITGSELWNASWWGHPFLRDYPLEMAVDQNTENIYITGATNMDFFHSNVVTIAYDSAGNELWNATYDGPANHEDEGVDIVLDSAGNVYITGFSMGILSDYDYVTIGYDTLGNELWVSRYNGPGNEWDKAAAIAIDDLGNLHVTGWCCGDAIGLEAIGDIGTIGYDSATGEELWSEVWVGSNGKRDLGQDITVDQNGNVYVTGYNSDATTFEDFITIKYSTTKVPPIAVTGVDQVTVENGIVQLDGTGSSDSDGSIISYSWDLDINFDSGTDGIPDNDVDVTGATPSIAGWNDDVVSTVKLTVKDNDGNTASDTMTVTVGNLDPTGTVNVVYNPAAGFVYDWTVSDPGSDDLTVTLEIGPLAPIVEVYYNDGVGADPNPSPYTGAAPFEVTENNILPGSLPSGEYDCYLTVEDDDLGTYMTSTTVTVPNQPPVADFSYSPLNPLMDELIQFTDTSTDPDDTVVAWSWDFGDGATSIDQNPTHSYSVIDSYTVSLTVWDTHNDMDSIAKTVDVMNQPPVAVFSFTPNNPLTNEIVTFTDFSYDPDGTVVSWLYDFGDGATSPDQNPTHSYVTSGSFSLSLIVWDEFGAMGTARDTIDVQNRPPVAKFSFTPDDPLVDETVAFTDLSTDPDDSVVSWLWDFGDGTTSTDQYPTHPYSETGSFTITLTVWDEHNSYDSVSKSVVVDKIVENQAPDAEFGYDPEKPEVGEDVSFTDLSSDPDGSIVQWEWDFGDGSTSSEKNPTYQYSAFGSFIVTLKVYDDSGAFAIASQEIKVAEPMTTSTAIHSFPWWILLLIAVVILLLFLLLFFWNRRRKRKEEEEADV